MVTRYQEALAIFKDKEDFVKDHQKARMALSITKVEDRVTSRVSQIIAKIMVDFDPPDHTRLPTLSAKPSDGFFSANPDRSGVAP